MISSNAFSLLILVNFYLSIQGQFYLPTVCLMTFDNASISSSPSNPNANIFICPSACYTMTYITNQQDYPLFGNVTYSGNSFICKAALHDARVRPWDGEHSLLFISNTSTQSTTFLSTLRNGVVSEKSVGISYLVYQFMNDRINETSIPDVAIEQRKYLYNQDQPSSITCRSKIDMYPIQPINIDNGWKQWSENRLKYFTFPRNYTREEALTFCSNNNGTFMYWANSTEQELLQQIFPETINDLFHYQRSGVSNNQLNFFIGLKQINQIQQWEGNIIPYNQSLQINFDSINTNSDYCTILQTSGSNSQSIRLYSYECNDTSITAYPLCRLLPSAIDEENDFIYRLETDSQEKDLTEVIDFCAELGGYPIYAYNAYDWQLIQEIMLKDPNFQAEYVYTGLISPTKQVNDAYWMPMNVSYNASLDYLWFASYRGSDRIAYHLSKAPDESYYGLYDINPYTPLNTLRFCRKPDIRSLIQPSPSCQYKPCTSQCQNITLPSQSDDNRFGFYACLPKNSLVGIVYTQSFPEQGDFLRPNLPMDYSVALRRNYNQSLILSFQQVDPTLQLSCDEYFNFDRTSTLGDTVALTCASSNTQNKTMSGIVLKEDFDGLISLALQDRRMSGHHFRYLDYESYDSRCRYQGVFHPYVNQCICAPGFYGSECQYSCPPGYYGQTCDYYCQGDDDYCLGLLICLPDPYGCSCYTGWYGTHCNISCPMGQYGPDCSYQCPCANCNRFTGVCDCNGTECYQGIYSRSTLQSTCSSSSTRLILIIVLPIISVAILISLIGIILYWKIIHSPKNSSALSASMIDERL